VAYHIRFAERQDMGSHYFFQSFQFSFNYFMSFEQKFDPLEKSEASLPVLFASCTHSGSFFFSRI
jgi:hypothetical protein